MLLRFTPVGTVEAQDADEAKQLAIMAFGDGKLVIPLEPERGGPSTWDVLRLTEHGFEKIGTITAPDQVAAEESARGWFGTDLTIIPT